MHLFITFSAKDITFQNNTSTKINFKHRLSLISGKLSVLCTIRNKIDFRKLKWVKIYFKINQIVLRNRLCQFTCISYGSTKFSLDFYDFPYFLYGNLRFSNRYISASTPFTIKIQRYSVYLKRIEPIFGYFEVRKNLKLPFVFKCYRKR